MRRDPGELAVGQHHPPLDVLARQLGGAPAEQLASGQMHVAQRGGERRAVDVAHAQPAAADLDLAVPAADRLGEERRAEHPDRCRMAEGDGEVLRCAALGERGADPVEQREPDRDDDDAEDDRDGHQHDADPLRPDGQAEQERGRREQAQRQHRAEPGPQRRDDAPRSGLGGVQHERRRPTATRPASAPNAAPTNTARPFANDASSRSSRYPIAAPMAAEPIRAGSPRGTAGSNRGAGSTKSTR